MPSNSGADLATYVGVAATLIGVLVPFILQWRKRRAKARENEIAAMLNAQSRVNPDGSTQLVVENWRTLTDALSRERQALSDELDRRQHDTDNRIAALQADLQSANLRISELEDDNAKLHMENADLYRKLSGKAGDPSPT